MQAESRYHQFTLANGLRVVAIKRENSKRFAATLAVRVGSREDPDGLDGLAHLVEHLVMSAGTNALILQDLARHGVYLNGETGWEKTRYCATGHISQFSNCLAFFANLLTKVPADPQAFSDEIQILTHEYIARARDDTHTSLAMERLWGPILGNQKRRRPGWKSVTRLRRHGRERIEPFHRNFYQPSNACLAVVSPHESGELKAQLAAQLGATRVGEKPLCPTSKAEYATVQPLVVFRCAGPQTRVQVFHHFHPIDRYPLAAVSLLCDVLGGGPHSELFRIIRQENRLAYSVGSTLSTYLDCAVLGVQALVNRRFVRPTLVRILKEISRLRTNGLQREAFDDARVRLIQKFDMLEDEWLTLSNFIVQEARREPEHPIPTPQTYRNLVQSLELAQFNEVARDLLAFTNRVVVLAGTVNLFQRWRIKHLLKSN
jgi:predicted Zn-dependent peptidase